MRPKKKQQIQISKTDGMASIVEWLSIRKLQRMWFLMDLMSSKWMGTVLILWKPSTNWDKVLKTGKMLRRTGQSIQPNPISHAKAACACSTCTSGECMRQVMLRITSLSGEHQAHSKQRLITSVTEVPQQNPMYSKLWPLVPWAALQQPHSLLWLPCFAESLI